MSREVGGWGGGGGVVDDVTTATIGLKRSMQLAEDEGLAKWSLRL